MNSVGFVKNFGTKLKIDKILSNLPEDIKAVRFKNTVGWNKYFEGDYI
jgi:hypothetical protein